MAFDDPLIERKLGDYTIVSLLGRGGMSRVYRGYDENLQRYAAVKVISGDFATTTEEEYTRRFTSEARAIAHLRHPNIVGVYQFGRTEGIYYMAQVFLEGQDLRTLLKSYAEKNQRIPVDQMLQIVRDVASALDYAHQQGVIHRDIKPSNIMLEKTSGRAILMDFGLAMSVHEGTMGDTFGSAHYIAPEQAISSAKSVPQSDQYSLGIVIYEMLAGKVPFDDPSIMSVALKHLNEVPPPPTMYNPDLPLAVEVVVLKALHKDPERRHASVTALADALEAAFAGASQSYSAPGRKTTGSPAVSAPVMADSSPTPAKRPISSGAFSNLNGAAPEGGVMGRFARRKMQREQDVAQSRRLDETDVPLDNQSIDSLLQSMDAPIERPITQERSRSDESLSGLLRPAAMRETVSVEPEVKPRRRSRGCLLLSLLFLFGVGAAAWFGLGLGEDDADITVTGTSATRAAALQLSMTAAVTSSPAGDLTSTTGTTTALAPTERSTQTVTALPTQTAPATSAVTLTTAAPEPSATATERPASTATTEAAPIITSTVTATPGNVSSAEQDVRAIYSADAFLLVNVSGETLDISELIFERVQPDGLVRSFQAALWDRPDISIKPNRMMAAGCYQLLTTTADQTFPDAATCPQFLGFFRSNVARSYFWTGGDAGAAFTVRLESAQAPLATCPIAAGECTFAIVAGESVTEAAAEATPSVEQVGEPTIRLTYDNRSFFLTNISEEAQDVSRLYFALEQPNGITRSFLSAEWDERGMAGETSALPAHSCLELVTSEADVVSPDMAYCTSLLGWFRSNVADRYFWVSSVPGQKFEVRIANEKTLLAVCEVDAGVCEFAISEQP